MVQPEITESSVTDVTKEGKILQNEENTKKVLKLSILSHRHSQNPQ